MLTWNVSSPRSTLISSHKADVINSINDLTTFLVRVQNEQFSEEKGFILSDTEKEV